MGMTGSQRLCLVLLFFCAMAVLVGLGSPYWYQGSVSFNILVAKAETDINVGIFYICGEMKGSAVGQTLVESKECRGISMDDKDGFDAFQVARLLCGASATILMCLGLASCCAMCCCGHSAACGIGGTAVIAGLIGVTGGGLFLYKTKDNLKAIQSIFSVISAFAKEASAILDLKADLSWGCYMYMGGCCGAILLGILLVTAFRKAKLVQMPIISLVMAPPSNGGPAYQPLV